MLIARDPVFWIKSFAHFYFTTLHVATCNMNRSPGCFRHHLVKGIHRRKGGRERQGEKGKGRGKGGVKEERKLHSFVSEVHLQTCVKHGLD